jgi:hypothetical protein
VPLADQPAQSIAPIFNESPPSANPEQPGTHAAQGAVLDMDLGAGFFAMATGSEGEVLGFGTIRYGRGSARVDYRENVSVQSASVPAETPVTIRLRYRVAFGRECFHDLDPSVLVSSDLEECLTDLEVRTRLDDLIGDNQNTTQNHFVNLGYAPTITGLFADPTDLGEATITAKVGHSFRLEVFADAASSHQLAMYQDILPTAASGSSLVLVFGIESDTPGVAIVSPLLGGVLPGFAGVNAANALAHVVTVDVGAPVVVPEAGAIGDGLAALAALAYGVSARARRRSRRPALRAHRRASRRRGPRRRRATRSGRAPAAAGLARSARSRAGAARRAAVWRAGSRRPAIPSQ